MITKQQIQDVVVRCIIDHEQLEPVGKSGQYCHIVMADAFRRIGNSVALEVMNLLSVEMEESTKLLHEEINRLKEENNSLIDEVNFLNDQVDCLEAKYT